jgi:TctA family transporter
VVVWAAVFVLFACTMGFGVVAMRRRPLQSWNWLPIFSGAFPVALLVGAVLGVDFSSQDAVFAAAALISALSLLPLGAMLQASIRREPESAIA